VGGLVLLSLGLITLSFRSSSLDGAQGTAASVLRPFEVAADRVARPFRDAAGWASGLIGARDENKKLKRQVESLRQQLYIDESALQENVSLKQQLGFHGPPSIADFNRVSAAVLTEPPNASDQSITIAAGTGEHLRVGDVVMTPDGLVGTVAKVLGGISRVTLLTDEESAVTATDMSQPTAIGIVQRGNGSGAVLTMDHVSKEKHVGVGDTIITNGNLGPGKFPSMFPRGILIGTVQSSGIEDINPYRSIQVQSFVDFSSLRAVIVLVPKTR
jgi:rod shape-determining protein MreC